MRENRIYRCQGFPWSGKWKSERTRKILGEDQKQSENELPLSEVISANIVAGVPRAADRTK
jgi:hypothetical protein